MWFVELDEFAPDLNRCQLVEVPHISNRRIVQRLVEPQDEVQQRGFGQTFADHRLDQLLGALE